MKLTIKHKYFDEIKAGKKEFEFRDAHITFIDEETKESLIKKVDRTYTMKKKHIIIKYPELDELLKDENIIVFHLK